MDSEKGKHMSQPSNKILVLTCLAIASIPLPSGSVSMLPASIPTLGKVTPLNTPAGSTASPDSGAIALPPSILKSSNTNVPVLPQIDPPRASTASTITIKASIPTGPTFSIDYNNARASTLISTKTKSIAATFSKTKKQANTHAAVAQAATQVNATPSIENNSVNLATINLTHATAVASRNSEPFAGKAKASSQNAITGIKLRTNSNTQNAKTAESPQSKPIDSDTLLNISWTIRQLELQTSPTVAFAFVRDTVDVLQQVGDQLSIDRIGFILYMENGKISRIPIDTTGKQSIASWLRQNIHSTRDGATVSTDTPLDVPIVLMDTNEPQNSVLLSLQNIHTEAAYETPPRAVPQTGEKAGYAPDAAASTNIHWSSETNTLTFDSASINILTNGDENRFDLPSPEDLLLGGSLTIDPFLYFTTYDNREYFSGNAFKLYDRNGNLLLQASLPTLVYENTLATYQGYDLFAPILNIQQAALGQSQWLDTFLSEIGVDSDFIPELFVDLGSIEENPWQQSFDTKGKVILSFATPYRRIFAPPTLLLLLPGLFLLRKSLRTEANG